MYISLLFYSKPLSTYNVVSKECNKKNLTENVNKFLILSETS